MVETELEVARRVGIGSVNINGEAINVTRSGIIEVKGETLLIFRVVKCDCSNESVIKFISLLPFGYDKKDWVRCRNCKKIILFDDEKDVFVVEKEPQEG